ncbi:MAG: protein tyrosine phosphatase [Planctomycetia bacterium]|nr:protein tyrosine phosphatase [Planctomycetia bacterium]
MIPLVDTHCHLLAGLDDGPRTPEEALEMCRMLSAEGVQLSAALAHQNDHYPDNSPQRIREAAAQLTQRLSAEAIPLTVFPCAEVMVHPDLETAWQEGQLQSMGGHGQYLLLEMPHGLFVNLEDLVPRLRQRGVGVILAHAERCPEWLHEPGAIETLIGLGCLVQLSSAGVTDPRDGRAARAVKDWLRRGVVHLLGTDAHSTRRRRPRMAEAYQQIVHWAGAAVADRVCSTNGMAVLTGLPVRVPAPEPIRRSWFSRLWQ